ncbi:unnamed protein product [Echinostoma caproni]|uniref:Polysaccharide biosynthesis protein n=1 Tax=Echinostoma caproni TaxID=27848 RepID=A0A183A9A0_9TREM|nr:unnamed protein product [Echinostoma caproni]
MLGLLRFTLFLSQLSALLKYAFDNDMTIVNNLLEVSSAFSMCGFFVAPITGAIMSTSIMAFRRKIARRLDSVDETLTDNVIYWTIIKGLVPVVTVLATVSLIMSCVVFVKGAQWVYYLAFACLIVMRSILFSSTTTMVITAFPTEYFGTVYGVINLIGGAFSLLQYGLLEMNIKVSNGICVAVSLLTFFPPIYMSIRKK